MKIKFAALQIQTHQNQLKCKRSGLVVFLLVASILIFCCVFRFSLSCFFFTESCHCTIMLIFLIYIACEYKNQISIRNFVSSAAEKNPAPK